MYREHNLFGYINYYKTKPVNFQEIMACGEAFILTGMGPCGFNEGSLSSPFWNKLPVNASSVKSFETLLDAHWQSLFSEVPI